MFQSQNDTMKRRPILAGSIISIEFQSQNDTMKRPDKILPSLSFFTFQSQNDTMKRRFGAARPDFASVFQSQNDTMKSMGYVGALGNMGRFQSQNDTMKRDEKGNPSWGERSFNPKMILWKADCADEVEQPIALVSIPKWYYEKNIDLKYMSDSDLFQSQNDTMKRNSLVILAKTSTVSIPKWYYEKIRIKVVNACCFHVSIPKWYYEKFIAFF